MCSCDPGYSGDGFNCSGMDWNLFNIDHAIKTVVLKETTKEGIICASAIFSQRLVVLNWCRIQSDKEKH